MAKTVRMTTAQAIVKFLDNQYVSMDGVETKFVEGFFTIFGHGIAVGLGEALDTNPGQLKVLQGRNALLLSEKEENYKAIGAAAGLAYNQIVGAESAVDINLAKQLNVVMTQLGVSADSIVMNVGSAAVGYGYEYVVSTMDRIKGAALGQNDNMLQMPIITPVSAETWAVKEATASEADMPEWGSADERGIDMEVMTAAADLAAGSDAVILRHPESVKTISKLIKALA